MLERIAEKPFYARVGLLGLAMYALLLIVLTPFVLAAGDSESVIFIVISILPALLVAFLVLRFGTWSYAVGALVPILGLLLFAEGIAEGLANPDSFFDFTFVIVGMVGLLMSVVGFTTTFFQARSGRASVSGPRMAVMVMRGLIGAIVVLSVGSAVLTIASIESVAARDKEGATVVRAKASEWETESIAAVSSGALRLLIKNSDPFLHTFTVDGLDIDVTVGPGSEKLVVLEKPQAGAYEFKCTIAGHESMKGALTVS